MNNRIELIKGQVSIIVLLVSAVVLALSLSASKRTVTETKIDTDEELLKEAFNTAESGINNYLDSGSSTYTSNQGEVTATVESSPIGNSDTISSEGQVLANESQFFWLVNHNADGSIGSDYFNGGNVYLATEGGFNGALKMEFFYIEGGVYKVRRIGCNYSGSSTVTGFDSSTTNCSTINTAGVSPLLIVVTPVGRSTTLTLSGTSGSPFPLQGEELTSVGKTETGVKTQVKTRNIYKVPSFLLDAVTARGRIQ
jgi:hypothetical protein